MRLNRFSQSLHIELVMSSKDQQSKLITPQFATFEVLTLHE